MRKALRAKYAKGYVSQEYMRTGIPRIEAEIFSAKLAEAEEFKKLLSSDTEVSGKCTTRGYKKRRAVEDRLIFV